MKAALIFLHNWRGVSTQRVESSSPRVVVSFLHPSSCCGIVFLDRMGCIALVFPHHPPDQAAVLTTHRASFYRDAGRACSRSRKA